MRQEKPALMKSGGEGKGLSALHLLPDEPDDHAVHAFTVGLGKGGDLGLIPFLYPDTYTVAFFLIIFFLKFS